jgi:hypothetical protein
MKHCSNAFLQAPNTRLRKKHTLWHRWIAHGCTVAWGVLLAAGCGSDPGDEGETERTKQVWAELQTGGYRTWDRAPGFDTRKPSNAAHGNAVDIFVNDTVKDALAGGPIAAWPVGSVIVKDGYEGSALKFMAYMEKDANNTWWWVEYRANGDVVLSGKPDGCTSCHSSGDDFVRAFSFPE